MRRMRGALAGLAVLAATASSGPPGPALAQAPAVSCSPEQPTVGLGGRVRVRAWAMDPGGGPLRYDWQATVGTVQGEAAEVRWDLADVRPGRYAILVRVTGAGGVGECVVRVVVRRDKSVRGGFANGPRPEPPPPPARTPRRAPAPARETGSAFLPAGRQETPGYGLYSYLLLGAPPGAAARERALEAIAAYLDLVPEIERLEAYVPRRELNVAYVPVTAPPAAAPTPEWVLAHYDYARARSLLRHLPGPTRDGPYIVSALTPLDRGQAEAGQYLFQDLSRVPPHLAAAWVREFLNQAAQERFWEERAGAQLALRLRLAVGILSVGLPEVRHALDSWIAWVR